MIHSIGRILVFLIVSSLVSSPALFAQEQDKEQSKAYLEQAQLMADASMALEDIRDVMIQAAEFDTTSLKANFEAGHLFLETINKQLAVKYLMRVYRQAPEHVFDIEYWIGLSYHFGMQFDQAITFYNRYKDKYVKRTDYKGKRVSLAEVERKIAECQTGKQLVASPKPFSIINVGGAINSEFEDYAPVLNLDETEIAFTTRRRDGNMNETVFSDNKPWEDIFYSKKTGDTWASATNIGSPVSAPNHESTLFMSPDGKTLYIYKDDGGGDIFISTKGKDDKWSVPQDLEEVNSNEYVESSMSITSDNKTLYFASNRPGGLGGLDIYTSTKDSRGNWSRPRNLGPSINTDQDEEGPFIDFTGKTLYFSSRGRKGMGLHDIYKSTLTDVSKNTWSEPENMGYPINTPDDDVFFVMSKDGKRAYYASVRPDGLGYSDIYRIEMLPEKAPAKVTIPVKLTVHVFDAATKAPLAANISLKAQADSAPIASTSTRTGTYDFLVTSGTAKDYTLSVESRGYTLQTIGINLPGASEKPNEITRTVEMKKGQSATPPPVVAPAKVAPVKLTVRVMDAATKAPLVATVSLRGKSDNVPVVSTNTGSGNFDFNITSETARDYMLTVEREGYVFQNVSINLPAATDKPNQITRTIELKKIQVGVTSVLRNIYFEFNKATLKPESFNELSKLENMMRQNAAVRVEIAGHTDNYGSVNYNQRLSLQRATAVRNFLTGKGIDPRRIQAAGYGATRPLASNDDEESGREINRRVEFKVIR